MLNSPAYVCLQKASEGIAAREADSTAAPQMKSSKRSRSQSGLRLLFELFQAHDLARYPHFERSNDANRLEKSRAVTAFQDQFRAALPSLLTDRSATDVAQAILDDESLSLDGWLAGYALQILILEKGVPCDLRGQENPRNASGWTPLHVAAAWGPDELLDQLLETASQDHLHLQDTKKHTILHYLAQRVYGAWDPATFANVPRLAQKMMRKGVECNAKSAGNTTALEDVQEFVATISQPDLESMGMLAVAQDLIRVLQTGAEQSTKNPTRSSETQEQEQEQTQAAQLKPEAIVEAARPARPGANLQELAAGAFIDAGGTAKEAMDAGYPDRVEELLNDAKLRFPTGSCVRFRGLRSAQSLNGRTGTVTGFLEDSSRFVVQKDVAYAGEARSVNVKGANLDLLPLKSLKLEQLQTMIESAPAGATVSIPRGEVNCTSGDVLKIKAAITLIGSGVQTSVLKCPVVVDDGVAGDRLQLSRFAVLGHSVRIAGAKLGRVVLSQIKIDVPHDGSGRGEDALVLDHIGGGHVLVKDCNITGGADGVMINARNVTLKGCHIVGAASRGVFANPSFVVEDCTIMGCGGYGMKTRSGCTRRGDNRIQAGPWDSHLQF